MQASLIARTEGVRHVRVRVGTCHMVIPVDQVLQALPLPLEGLTALPRRSGGLLGMAEVAGSVVPIVALERWLPMGVEGDRVGSQRLLVLQHAGAQVGIRVDAVLGVSTVVLASIRRVLHAPDESELFESVVPMSASDPMLCILEVARLMRLTQAWCEAAELPLPEDKETSLLIEKPVSQPPTRRYALFLIDMERWAVPVEAVLRVAPLPAIELALSGGRRSWAISQWQGRKLPLVDISTGRQPSNRQSAPLMVLLTQGSLALGLTVSACQQFLDIEQEGVAPSPDDDLLAGVALLPELGKLRILDVAKLFALTPEASISRGEFSGGDVHRSTAPTHATEPQPYLVFDAGQRYCSPIGGIVGVVELSPTAREELLLGRKTVFRWRDNTVHVVNFPAISVSKGVFDPLLAVLVQAPQSASPPIGIAIQSLCDWLPAHSARRMGMRMGAMGELGLINAKGALDHVNLVEVDLAQMAYLLG